MLWLTVPWDATFGNDATLLYAAQRSECITVPERICACIIGKSVTALLSATNWTKPVAGVVDVSASPNTHKSLLGLLPRPFFGNMAVFMIIIMKIILPWVCVETDFHRLGLGLVLWLLV